MTDAQVDSNTYVCKPVLSGMAVGAGRLCVHGPYTSDTHLFGKSPGI